MKTVLEFCINPQDDNERRFHRYLPDNPVLMVGDDYEASDDVWGIDMSIILRSYYPHENAVVLRCGPEDIVSDPDGSRTQGEVEAEVASLVLWLTESQGFVEVFRTFKRGDRSTYFRMWQQSGEVSPSCITPPSQKPE